jgi:hypothetical protein
MLIRRLVLAALAALVLALVLVVAGCGGGGQPTPEDYAKAVIVNRNRVDFVLTRIAHAKSVDELLNRMDEAAAVIDKAAGELDDKGAPEEYQPEADNLVKQMRQLSVDLQATADQAREPGFGGLVDDPHLQGLSFDSWTNMNKALAGLAGKGIQVSIVQPKASQ